jgi:hypothetical protein
MEAQARLRSNFEGAEIAVFFGGRVPVFFLAGEFLFLF